jgi:hypothetical protein
MSKTLVPLLSVTVRRDANTITPVTVPPHELTILRSIFGKENVQEGERVGEVELVSSEEHGRLSAKYGAQRVAKIYGDDEGERLTELVEKAAVKAQKATADKAPKGDKSSDKAPE